MTRWTGELVHVRKYLESPLHDADYLQEQEAYENPDVEQHFGNEIRKRTVQKEIYRWTLIGSHLQLARLKTAARC